MQESNAQAQPGITKKPVQSWRSESIAKLSTALAKAQAEFPNIEKKKTAEIRSDKGSYSYKYADLADVIAATRPSLSKNELAVLQIIRHEDGKQILQATLTHSSGEWIQSEIEIPRWGTPQILGSLLTYLRRYLYTAILGVAADEDDDGRGAGDTGYGRPAQGAPKPQGNMWTQGGGAKPQNQGRPVQKGPSFKETLASFGWEQAQAEEWVKLKFRLGPNDKSTPAMIDELMKVAKVTPPDQAIYMVKDPI